MGRQRIMSGIANTTCLLCAPLKLAVQMPIYDMIALDTIPGNLLTEGIPAALVLHEGSKVSCSTWELP